VKLFFGSVSRWVKEEFGFWFVMNLGLVFVELKISCVNCRCRIGALVWR
jgi:hypothetical protein